MSIELRSDRVVFKVSGADATHLLGDVLTPALSEGDGPAKWFALLAPQGKILAEGLIGWADEAWWLDVHESVADNFFKRMRMYKLRANLEIEMLGETHSVAWSAEQPSSGIVHQDGRADGLGWRLIASRDDAKDWTSGDRQARARIASGIAELGPDFDADDVFPHDIGMDHLAGVDFKKGCYVGQEVVSRMQHRGTARRRPVIVSGLGTAARGDSITVGGRNAGTLGAPIGEIAVAIVRIDKIGAPDAAEVNGHAVTLALPAWASYRFSESGEPSSD